MSNNAKVSNSRNWESSGINNGLFRAIRTVILNWRKKSENDSETRKMNRINYTQHFTQ